MTEVTDGFIIHGSKPTYEPSKEGLGYELFRCLNLYKGRIAQYITDTNEADTYDAVKERSVRVAINLLKHGITENDVVCMCSHNHLNSCVLFVASLLIGVKFVALEPTQPESDLNYILSYVKPKVIFISDIIESVFERMLKTAQWNYQIVVFGESAKYAPFGNYLKPDKEENNFMPSSLKSNKETAILFFSSGSTGKPKGICCSHYGFLGQLVNVYHYLKFGNSINLSNYSHRFNNETDFKMMSTSPLYWITGSMVTTLSILTGSTRVLSYGFQAFNFLETIQDFKVNIILLQTSQANELFSARKLSTIDTKSLQLVLLTGAPVKEQHLLKMQSLFPEAKCVSLYGMTEASGSLTLFDLNDPEDLQFVETKLTSCGRSIPGISYKVVDPITEKPVGVNIHGELRVKSSYLMKGFYMSDSSNEYDSDSWFKTGDLVHYDEDGCFYIDDRIKNMLKYSIYTIRPSVIEAVLAQHPAVSESFVFGYPHEDDNEHPMGVVVLKKNSKNVTAEEICSYVNERVDDRYKLRAGNKFIEVMLRTPTGKIQKLAIKSLILKGKI